MKYNFNSENPFFWFPYNNNRWNDTFEIGDNKNGNNYIYIEKTFPHYIQRSGEFLTIV